MNSCVRMLAACVVAVLAVGGFAGPAVAAPSELTPAAVAKLVSAHLGAARLPGVAVAVTRADEVVHVGGYGHTSEGDRVTQDTRMRVGSVSKSFTALAIMRLVDAGKVALDEPVVSYLPEFRVADPRGADITVRQLLNHTSGLSDLVHPESSGPQPDSLAEAVAALKPVTLDDDPGAAHHYHNPNYQVAARIVEVVSGKSFQDYQREHILEPAGMDDTVAVADYSDAVPGVADGYNRWFGLNVARAESDRFVMGSAGIVSTATDLASWLVVQGNEGMTSGGERLVAAESVRAMHTATGGDVDYGLGWDSIHDQGARQTVHNGTSFTYTAEVRLLPESGYGFAVLTNTRQPLEAETEAIMAGLIDLAHGRHVDTAVPAAFYWELILIAASVVGVGIPVWRLGRFRRRAVRRGRDWRLVGAAAPALAAVATLVFLPALLTGLMGDREVTWTLIWHLTPTLPTCLAVVGVATAATTFARWRASAS